MWVCGQNEKASKLQQYIADQVDRGGDALLRPVECLVGLGKWVQYLFNDHRELTEIRRSQLLWRQAIVRWAKIDRTRIDFRFPAAGRRPGCTNLIVPPRSPVYRFCPLERLEAGHVKVSPDARAAAMTVNR